MPRTQRHQASDDRTLWKFQQRMGREPVGCQGRVGTCTAAGWAEAGRSHARQGGDVEKVWALGDRAHGILAPGTAQWPWI